MVKFIRDYVDHENFIKIEKGTDVEVVDFVAKSGNGGEWVEVILSDGKHLDVPASAVG